MGARQSKRSVDITTTPKKEAGANSGDSAVIGDAAAPGDGKLERIEESDAKPTTNGIALHTDLTEDKEKDKDEATEKDKDLQQSEEAKTEDAKQQEPSSGESPVEGAEVTTPTDANATSPSAAAAATSPDSKEPKKKEKMRKKWSLRSISFSKKDKSKPTREETPKNGDVAKEEPLAEGGEEGENTVSSPVEEKSTASSPSENESNVPLSSSAVESKEESVPAVTVTSTTTDTTKETTTTSRTATTTTTPASAAAVSSTTTTTTTTETMETATATTTTSPLPQPSSSPVAEEKKEEPVPTAPIPALLEDKKEEEAEKIEKEKNVVEVSPAADGGRFVVTNPVEVSVFQVEQLDTPSIIERKTSEDLPVHLPSSPPPTPIETTSPLQQQIRQTVTATTAATILANALEELPSDSTADELPIPVLGPFKADPPPPPPPPPRERSASPSCEGPSPENNSILANPDSSSSPPSPPLPPSSSSALSSLPQPSTSPLRSSSSPVATAKLESVREPESSTVEPIPEPIHCVFSGTRSSEESYISETVEKEIERDQDIGKSETFEKEVNKVQDIGKSETPAVEIRSSEESYCSSVTFEKDQDIVIETPASEAENFEEFEEPEQTEKNVDVIKVEEIKVEEIPIDDATVIADEPSNDFKEVVIEPSDDAISVDRSKDDDGTTTAVPAFVVDVDDTEQEILVEAKPAVVIPSEEDEEEEGEVVNIKENVVEVVEEVAEVETEIDDPTEAVELVEVILPEEQIETESPPQIIKAAAIPNEDATTTADLLEEFEVEAKSLSDGIPTEIVGQPISETIAIVEKLADGEKDIIEIVEIDNNSVIPSESITDQLDLTANDSTSPTPRSPTSSPTTKVDKIASPNEQRIPPSSDTVLVDNTVPLASVIPEEITACPLRTESSEISLPTDELSSCSLRSNDDNERNVSLSTETTTKTTTITESSHQFPPPPPPSSTSNAIDVTTTATSDRKFKTAEPMSSPSLDSYDRSESELKERLTHSPAETENREETSSRRSFNDDASIAIQENHQSSEKSPEIETPVDKSAPREESVEETITKVAPAPPTVPIEIPASPPPSVPAITEDVASVTKAIEEIEISDKAVAAAVNEAIECTNEIIADAHHQNIMNE